jgi:predicted nucleic acid-binding protein
MIPYFDSSLLLSILFEEPRKEEAVTIWNSFDLRLASVLLKIETNISLKRFYKQAQHRLPGDWLQMKKDELETFLKKVVFIDISEKFADAMAENNALAGCKSLDAIHIATALHVGKRYGNENVRVCSFDKMMVRTAQEFGFAV